MLESGPDAESSDSEPVRKTRDLRASMIVTAGYEESFQDDPKFLYIYQCY